MRAIILAVGSDEPSGTVDDPSPLRPVLDVPMLQLVIERLVTEGVRQIHVATCTQADRIERRIGDGTRWGVSIRYHLVRDPSRPLEVLRRLDLTDDGAWWVASGDRLPQVELHDLGTDVVIGHSQGSRWTWSGWARLSAIRLRALPGEERAAAATLRRGGVRRCSVEVWDVRTPRGLLDANRAALTATTSATMVAKSTAPGLWIGRGAVVHARAHLEPPVFVGADAMIGADARIGPHAVIGSGCVVDVGAHVEEAVIDADTYLGAGVEVREAIVSRRRLHNLTLDLDLEIPDNHLVGDLRSSGWRDRALHMGWRVVGMALTGLLYPAVMYAQRSKKRRYGVLAKLPRIARGEVRLVGRREDLDMETLPPDWRTLLENTPVGLITPHRTLPHDADCPHEKLALDTWYATHRNLRLDASLVAKFVKKKLTG